LSRAKSRPRVKKEEVEEKKFEKVEMAAVTQVKPSGRTPQAEVFSRHGDGMVARRGKGFSVGEIGRATFPMSLASRWSLPIDLRRRSVLDANIQTLMKWRPAPQEPAEPVRVERAPSKVVAHAKPVKKRPPAKKKKKSKRKSSAR
jgi:ribosomal protein L13E